MQARAAQQADDKDSTEVVTRSAFPALGSLFGGKAAQEEEEEETVVAKPARGGLFGRKAAVEEEEESDSETAVVSRPFAGLFGGKKAAEEPEEEAPKRGGLFGGAKRTAPAPAPARGGTQRGGTQRGGTQRGGMSAEERKKAREEAAAQKRREAEERQQAAAEARAQAKAEAEKRKQVRGLCGCCGDHGVNAHCRNAPVAPRFVVCGTLLQCWFGWCARQLLCACCWRVGKLADGSARIRCVATAVQDVR